MRCLTGYQFENFYKEKKPEYFLDTNKSFKKWFKKEFIPNTYDYEINNIKKIIQFLKNWCIFKYPENELNKPNIIISCFEYIENLEDKLDINQMLYRINSNDIFLIECSYSTGSAALIQIPISCEKDKYTYSSEDRFAYSLYFNLSKQVDRNYSLHDRYNNIRITSDGYVDIEKANEILECLGEKIVSGPLNIKNFYEIINNYKEVGYTDLEEIESCIKRHDYLYKLRNYILEFTGYELIYNEDTNFHNGYLRFEKLINELMLVYTDLDFDLSKFKNIVEKDYPNK